MQEGRWTDDILGVAGSMMMEKADYDSFTIIFHFPRTSDLGSLFREHQTRTFSIAVGHSPSRSSRSRKYI